MYLAKSEILLTYFVPSRQSCIIKCAISNNVSFVAPLFCSEEGYKKENV